MGRGFVVELSKLPAHVIELYMNMSDERSDIEK